MRNISWIKTKIIVGTIFILISCSPPPAMETEQSWAEQTLNELSLREKISQMLIYPMHLKFRNENSKQQKELIELVETDGIGGIHLWSGSSGLSVTMLNELQRKSKVPIIVDMDIEKGVAARFNSGTQVPVMMAIAATGDPQNAFDVGNIIAKEGRSVGVHWNLAPVVDVNINPDNPIINTRTFSDDPQVVAEYTAKFIEGMHSGGMITTAKHFPGHGDTQSDSHLNLTIIPSDSSRLWSVELAPFKAAIAAGVDAIMVGHLIAPDYQTNGTIPATFSKFWLQDILRGELGFTGAIITDAMDMKSITNNYSDDFALISAINAGCDVIIQNHKYKQSLDTIENAVKTGLIKEARINEAALKMLKLKEKAGLHLSRRTNFKTIQRSLESFGTANIVNKIAEKSLTLVKNDNNLFPLTINKDEKIFLVDLNDNTYNHKQSFVTKSLLGKGLPVESMVVDESDSTAYFKTLIEQITNGSQVILNSFAKPRAGKGNANLNEPQTYLIKQLLERTNRITLISFGNPYLIRDFPKIQAYLCAWSDQPLMQRSAAKALLGQIDINGKLPIKIPGIAKRGSGIELSAKPLKYYISPKQVGKRLKQFLPYELGIDANVLNELMNEAVSDSAFPGGVLLAVKDGQIFINNAFGHHTYGQQNPVNSGNIFDIASITKVVATTAAIMKLYDEGKLTLDDSVGKYINEFVGYKFEDVGERKMVTIRHLLTHTAGLPPFELFYEIEGDIEDRYRAIYSVKLAAKPGEKYVYSDIGFMLLGKIVEKISGQKLDEYVNANIFEPLGMTDTFFNPEMIKVKRIVPTEYSESEKGFIKGHVHDENACSVGGVSGHAGLFSTAQDLAIFSQMMLNGGIYGDVRIFDPETVELFTTISDQQIGDHYLGWGKPTGQASGGVYLSDNSYGHTGFTGTSLWIDPDNNVIVILLTNAVHPHREWKDPKYYDWRQRIHSAVYESLGFNSHNPNLEWRKNWDVK